MTNRALLIAAMADGVSTIEGILRSDDSYWCIRCLRQLGIRVDIKGDTAIVHGSGGKWPIAEGGLYVGAAGTAARFLPPALAAGSGSWRLDGSSRMRERPLAPLLDALVGLGAEIRYEAESGCMPLSLIGGGLAGGTVTMAGSVSSQFISGLLIAAPYAREPLTIAIDGPVVQRDYVAMTAAMMRQFGVQVVESDGGQTLAAAPGIYRACALSLEPDVSTCGYFWALAALTNRRIRIGGISATATKQPDIELLALLRRMGCETEVGGSFAEVRGTPKLRGGFTASMKRCSDQTLTIAALAPFADAPIRLTDAAHIRHHECDRIAAMCGELTKLGIRVEEHPDGMTIFPGLPQPALLDPHDDHRMAMALSLIGVRTPGLRIANPGCVSKTCPDFFDRLAGLGAELEFV